MTHATLKGRKIHKVYMSRAQALAAGKRDGLPVAELNATIRRAMVDLSDAEWTDFTAALHSIGKD